MKQVPATQQVEIDPVTGAMKRASDNTRTNPYDLYALESALLIREKTGGTVSCITMGPPHAEGMMKDAYAMGADDALILSDRKFAGADVLATSFTLAQGIETMGEFDLILCGRQTTDGDTAQVGPSLAEHLGIPHAAWVEEIVEVTDTHVTVRQNFGSVTQTSRIALPCLITVDQDLCVPRLPSYRLKKATAGKPVRLIGYEDLGIQDLTRYGLVGSPTAVEQMFTPPVTLRQQEIEGHDGSEKAERLYVVLKAGRII